MSRIISELYRPPPPDPVHSYISDQSELEERSLASDIGEESSPARLPHLLVCVRLCPGLTCCVVPAQWKQLEVKVCSSSSTQTHLWTPA